MRTSITISMSKVDFLRLDLDLIVDFETLEDNEVLIKSLALNMSDEEIADQVRRSFGNGDGFKALITEYLEDR